MLKQLHKRLVRPILEAHDSPEAVAGGVAIGLGLAMTPTVGIQMPLAWLLATMCGANRVVAIALVWLSNPLTVVPMYYLEYMLGSRLLARESVTSYQEFQALWASLSDLAYLARIRALSDALLLPLVVGSACPAVVVAATSYPTSVWWLRRRRKQLAGRTAPGVLHGGEAAEAEADTAAIAGEPVLPSPSSPADVDPNKARIGALLLLGLVPVLGGCMDRRSGTTAASVPAPVSLKDQQCAVWVGASGLGPTAWIGPIHPGDTQSDYTQERLRAALPEPLRPVTFLSLEVHHLVQNGEEISFGAGPVVVEMAGPAGRSRSLAPSVLLEHVRRASDRTLMSALLGGESLPALREGQALRLLVAMPERADWQEAQSVEVSLGETRLSLRRRVLPAEEWDLLLQQPRDEAMAAFLKDPDERP